MPYQQKKPFIVYVRYQRLDNKLQQERKMQTIVFIIAVIILLSHSNVNALLRRCYQCRSRGDLGSCKDPFTFNATDVDREPGLSAIPCASGWCGKVIEGGGAFAVDDYDLAIQRMCLQRGPDDNMDRCADTIYNYKKVYMCFCQGDLCNSSNRVQQSSLLWLTATTLTLTALQWGLGTLAP